jgi:hypothetical protein
MMTPAGTSRTRLDALRDRAWAFTRARVRRLVYTGGGLGDELMLTAAARAAREQGRPLHILTDRPEVWEGNGDPASVQTGVERWHYAARRGWVRAEIAHLSYRMTDPLHIGEQIAARAGIDLPPRWKPVLNVPADPATAGAIVLQNSCRGALYAADTKEWADERWRELALRLSPRVRLLQLGTPADPPLTHAEDLRGRTTLRQAASLIAGAHLFLGLESGLMHVAAAVGTPAVIVYGGRSRPESTGYSGHTAITRTPPCVGCGLNSGCPRGRMCLDIPVDEVEAAVLARLA